MLSALLESTHLGECDLGKGQPVFPSEQLQLVLKIYFSL
jgi:hypothetical protein